MKKGNSDISDKFKENVPNMPTCKGMQSDNGHHYCWFTGEACGYKQKENCEDYRIHIKPREERRYVSN